MLPSHASCLHYFGIKTLPNLLLLYYLLVFRVVDKQPNWFYMYIYYMVNYTTFNLLPLYIFWFIRIRIICFLYDIYVTKYLMHRACQLLSIILLSVDFSVYSTEWFYVLRVDKLHVWWHVIPLRVTRVLIKDSSGRGRAIG